MRALIVDDEPLAVDNLVFYLKGYPIEIAGSAGSIREAKERISQDKPDVIFLDINLSGESGFDLLEYVGEDCAIVFVTAYDEFAVRAFEVNALDYILKPLKQERIAKAVERLLTAAPREIPRQSYSLDDTLFLSTGNRACFLKVRDVRFLQADGCYSRIFSADGACISSTKTLKKWGELLPEQAFIRIHRSFIINVGHIGDIRKRNNGTYAVFLPGVKDPIEISRRCASTLKHRLCL